MPAWALTVDVDAPPDVVWAFIGDPTTVPRWYPKYVACEVAGDRRVLRSAEGAELHERLLERDDARRFYSYSVTAGAPVASHLASFEVSAEGVGRHGSDLLVEPALQHQHLLRDIHGERRFFL